MATRSQYIVDLLSKLFPEVPKIEEIPSDDLKTVLEYMSDCIEGSKNMYFRFRTDNAETNERLDRFTPKGDLYIYYGCPRYVFNIPEDFTTFTLSDATIAHIKSECVKINATNGIQWEYLRI